VLPFAGEDEPLVAALIKTARLAPFPFVQLTVVPVSTVELKVISLACVAGGVETVPDGMVTFTLVAVALLKTILPE